MGFRLTTRNLKAVIGPDMIAHIVDTADFTDNPSGSSFKAVLSESYIPLAGTKALFPVLGDIETDPLAPIRFIQYEATTTSYFGLGTSATMFSQDAVTLIDYYQIEVVPTEITYRRNGLIVALLDVAENFGIGQTTTSAEYQINSLRALSTKGSNCLFVGNSGLLNSGAQNCFVGSLAGRDNTTGFQNTYIGYATGLLNTTGSENCFLGNVTGQDNTTGSRNTFFGKQTGWANTTGSDAVILGYRAGLTLTTGNENVFIGNNSGNLVVSGSRNVFIGRFSGLVGAQRSGSVAIGNQAVVDADNSFILGGTGANFVKVGVGTTIPTAFMDLPICTTAIATSRWRRGIDVTTPNEGDMWNSSVFNTIVKRLSGITQYDSNVIRTKIADTTIANTTTETTMMSSALSLPANMWTPQKSIRFEYAGFLTSSANPTVTIKIKIGAVTILASAVLNIGNNASNVQFTLKGFITCRTIGGVGTFIGQAEFLINPNTFTGASKLTLLDIATSVVDTTIANNFDATFQWGTANATNTVTITNNIIELLN